ncbi:MAG: hypothetical protein BWY77_01440 [bacterium ADurb.Bin431]|nr:MAG: hypothetical protein BWY77_01440 [bacterium ADurb.Bin431]
MTADFHRHGNLDLGLDCIEDIKIELFGLACRGAGVSNSDMDIELEGVGAGGLELPGIARPPFGGDAVDTGDHRNLDRLFYHFQHGTVLLRAVLLAQFRAHIVIGLCMSDGPGLQIPLLASEGFLEEAFHHHRRGPGLLAGADLVRRPGQPAAGDDDRILELKIHEAGLHCHLVPLLIAGLVVCAGADPGRGHQR